jgi:hypothetical protein
VGNIRDFLVKIPFLCETDNPERWSRVIELVYDDEIANPDGPFSKNSLDEKNPANRFEVAFGFRGNTNKINHCQKLVELLFLSHYKNEHGETGHDERISALVASIKSDEENNLEIASVLSATEAVSAASWNV